MNTWTFEVTVEVAAGGPVLTVGDLYLLTEGVSGCLTSLRSDGRKVTLTYSPRTFADLSSALDTWARSLALLGYLLAYPSNEIAFGEARR